MFYNPWCSLKHPTFWAIQRDFIYSIQNVLQEQLVVLKSETWWLLFKFYDLTKLGPKRAKTHRQKK